MRPRGVGQRVDRQRGCEPGAIGCPHRRLGRCRRQPPGGAAHWPEPQARPPLVSEVGPPIERHEFHRETHPRSLLLRAGRGRPGGCESAPGYGRSGSPRTRLANGRGWPRCRRARRPPESGSGFPAKLRPPLDQDVNSGWRQRHRGAAGGHPEARSASRTRDGRQPLPSPGRPTRGNC